MALQYKDVVSLAETGSNALVATIRQLGVVELPLIIDKCCKTVAISSVSIDLPNNLYLLTRKDSDYIF